MLDDAYKREYNNTIRISQRNKVNPTQTPGATGGRARKAQKGRLTMKKRWTTFDEATAQYTDFAGKVPEYGQMIDLYHRYRNEWTYFKDFHDWLMYRLEVTA